MFELADGVYVCARARVRAWNSANSVPSKFNQLKFVVQGPEDGKPTYLYELTTSFFAIDDDGTLVVAEDNLDRDPPSPGKFRFQVCK